MGFYFFEIWLCSRFFCLSSVGLKMCVNVHFCLRFVVVEVIRKTAGWSLVAVSLLPNVAAVVSGGLHLMVTHAAGPGEWFRAVTSVQIRLVFMNPAGGV